MAVAIRLTSMAGVDLVPSDTIVGLSYRSSSGSTTETDINGTPVVISYEYKAMNSGYDIEIGYVELGPVQTLIAAYQANTLLTLWDEAGLPNQVRIANYPVIERFKTAVGGAAFTVKLVLQNRAIDTADAKIITRNGPRLFGR